MKFNLIASFTLLLVLFSCSKDKSNEIPIVFQDEGYIYGKFGTETLYYTVPLNFNKLPDTNSNVSFSSGFMALYRFDAKVPTRGISIISQGLNLDQLPLNETLPYAELQLNNLICQTDTTNGPHDSCNYYGNTFNHAVDIRITDKQNDVLTGTFSGIIRTNTGLSKCVTDGRFRIRMIRVQM
jgi:hypothetical protein